MGKRSIRQQRRHREAQRLAFLAPPQSDDTTREEAPAEASPAAPPPAADLAELQE